MNFIKRIKNTVIIIDSIVPQDNYHRKLGRLNLITKIQLIAKVTVQPEQTVKRPPHEFPPNLAPPNQWTRKAKPIEKKIIFVTSIKSPVNNYYQLR